MRHGDLRLEAAADLIGDMPLQGRDSLTIAELVGHCDGTILAEAYEHFGRNTGHFKNAPAD